MARDKHAWNALLWLGTLPMPYGMKWYGGSTEPTVGGWGECWEKSPRGEEGVA